MSYIFDNAFEAFVGLEKTAQARWKRELLKVNDSTLPLFQLDGSGENYELTNIDNPGKISLTTGNNVLTNKDLKDSLFNRDATRKFYPRLVDYDVRRRLNIPTENILFTSPNSVENRPGRKLSDMRLRGAVTLDHTGNRVVNRVVQHDIPGFNEFTLDSVSRDLNNINKDTLNSIIEDNEYLAKRRESGRISQSEFIKARKDIARSNKRFTELARDVRTKAEHYRQVLPKDIPVDIPVSRLPVVVPKSKGNPTAPPTSNNRLRALGYGAAGLAALGGLYGLYKHYND